MAGIDKAFGGVPALEDASLRVAPAEVHALIGQNGAGKSTLIKILTGVYGRDAGTIRFDGREVSFSSPQAAQRGGISPIYQEINLVPYRTVAENVFLAREPRRFGVIDRGRMHREAAALLERVGITVDVTVPLMALNTATQQMVAIARALSFESKLLIMDEPTSSLHDREVETLFEVIRTLRADGVSVIFVSHKLDELYAVCDRVTIMRDGRTVATAPMADVSKLQLVATMLGKDLTAVSREGATGFAEGDRETGEQLLEVTGMARGRALRDASVRVRAGEIVGLAGLLGSGRTELARAVYGADRREDGSVRVHGKEADFSGPADAIRAGIGFTSEDRKAEGIIPEMSVRENITLALLPVLSRHGVVSRDRQREIVDRFIDRLGIKTSGPDQKIRELSGGNQQKVLLARSLALEPKLLILDEPTRGIDVGAKGEIQSLINELADSGLGVLMISSELEELTEGSDRVVVLRDGRTVAELREGEVSEDAIMAAMAEGSGVVAGDAGAEVPGPARPRRRRTARSAAVAETVAARPGGAAPRGRRRSGRAGAGLRRGRGARPLLLYNVVFTDNFLTLDVLRVNLTQVATIVIVATGMTLVIATGGIDLSVGSLMAIAGALAPLIFSATSRPSTCRCSGPRSRSCSRSSWPLPSGSSTAR
jgi:ribose transport system ATP-binding protein